MKKSTTFRLSPEGLKLLVILSKQQGISQASMLEILIRDRAQTVTYTERMAAAANLDEALDIARAHEKVIHDLEVSVGLKPTVGVGGSGYKMRGFSTLSKAECTTLIRRVASLDKFKGNQMRRLVQDGLAMETWYKTLLIGHGRERPKRKRGTQ